MMEDLKQLSAITALNAMMEKGYFDICTIDNIGKMLGIDPKHCEGYRILYPLHCVHFNKMPDELRKAIPGLSIEPTFQFEQPKPTPTTAVVVSIGSEQARQRRSLLGFLK